MISDRCYPQMPAGGQKQQLARPSSAPSVPDAGSTSAGSTSAAAGGSPAPGSPVHLPSGRPASLSNLATALGRPGSPGLSPLARGGSAGSSVTGASAGPATSGVLTSALAEPTAALRTGPPPAVVSAAAAGGEVAKVADVKAQPTPSLAEIDPVAEAGSSPSGSPVEPRSVAESSAASVAAAIGASTAAEPALDAALRPTFPDAKTAAKRSAQHPAAPEADSVASAASADCSTAGLASSGNGQTAAQAAEGAILQAILQAEAEPTGPVTQPAQELASFAGSAAAGLGSSQQRDISGQQSVAGGGNDPLVPPVAVAPDAQTAVEGVSDGHAGPNIIESEPPVGEAVSANAASPSLASSRAAIADVRADNAESQLATPGRQAVTADADAPAVSAVAGDSPAAAVHKASTAPAEAPTEAMASVMPPEAAGPKPPANANGIVSHGGLLAEQPQQALAPVAALGSEEGPDAARLEAAESTTAPLSAPDSSEAAAATSGMPSALLDGALHDDAGHALPLITGVAAGSSHLNTRSEAAQAERRTVTKTYPVACCRYHRQRRDCGNHPSKSCRGRQQHHVGRARLRRSSQWRASAR